jgi:hypothetical protein
MMRTLLGIFVLALLASVAPAEPDPKRKVAVIAYRAGSSGLPGIATRVGAALGSRRRSV